MNSQRLERNADLHITGSNAHVLSGELTTLLAGRYIEIPVFPFSFHELLEAFRLVHAELSERRAFSEYLLTGGMPYVSQLSLSPGAARPSLQDLFVAVELKDIT